MKIIFTFFSCLVVSLLSSQDKKILKVEYDEIVSYMPQIVNNDKGILYVSTDKSYYKTMFDNVSLTDDIDEESIVIPSKGEEYFSEILIEKNIDTLIENLFERYAFKKFISVNEEIPKMKWELFDSVKKIGDYLCKKAITNFRGRVYNVFYTDEIPVSAGPWKFNGLPGLILYVEDTQGVFKWRATSIVYNYEEIPKLSEVYDRIQKFKKMNFKDFDFKLIEAIKNKYSTVKARNGQRNQNLIVEFSTKQWKEPINKWRSQTDFSF